MNALRLAIALAALAALSQGAAAQPGRAGGPCPAASGASAPYGGCGPDGRMGRMGPMGGGPHWGRNDTPGWPMMSQQERLAHRDRMTAFKSYDECKAYVDQHRQEMVDRAKARGLAAPPQQRRDPCAPLKPGAKP